MNQQSEKIYKPQTKNTLKSIIKMQIESGGYGTFVYPISRLHTVNSTGIMLIVHVKSTRTPEIRISKVYSVIKNRNRECE